MRDALSDLLRRRPGTRRWSTARGGSPACSVEIVSEFLTSPEALTEEHPAAERPLARRRWSPSRALLPLAQGDDFVRDPPRRTSCVADNDTFCVGWALDNFDRYVDPTLEHLASWSSSRSLRLRDRLRDGARLTSPPVARARRSPASPASSTRSPASPSSCCCCRSPGAGRHRGDRPHPLHAADHLPQHRHRAGGVPAERRTPAAAWE